MGLGKGMDVKIEVICHICGETETGGHRAHVSDGRAKFHVTVSWTDDSLTLPTVPDHDIRNDATNTGQSRRGADGLTRQQRWVANHPEQRRVIHRDGQRRRRAG